MPCWTYPLLRTLIEYGVGQKARMSVEDNSFIRITIPADFTWRPGQHCFLRFCSFGIHALSSHPFTICSLPSTSPTESSKLVFYIRHRGGFTARLHSYASTRSSVQVPVLIDGPYGGIENRRFFGSDRIIVIAGGTGVGWMLPFVEQFLRLYHSTASLAKEIRKKDRTTNEAPLSRHFVRGPRSMRVILATRDVATRTLFHTALNNLLSTYKALGSTTPADISIEIHLTGGAERIAHPPSSNSDSDPKDSGSSSSLKGEDVIEKDPEACNKMSHHTNHAQTGNEKGELRGRPDLPLIIREEATAGRQAGGLAVGVYACGPLTMQNDIRNAVAKENLNILRNPTSAGGSSMYLHLEHFSWA